MALPFSLKVKMLYHLPDGQVIADTGKIRGLVWISEPGRVDPGRRHPNHYRLAPSMACLLCRYGLDR